MGDKVSSVTFVIPCLNEQQTLPTILQKINKVCAEDLAGRDTEVLVSDNGSTDDSVKIAEEHGARVVHCAERGYGAALLNGIENASNEVVIFADADNTYDFMESPKLILELDAGDYDMVVGSRLDGEVHKGAMPVLHRHLGTPILNFFINLLYARKGNKITDCNSGFRCFKKASFLSWGVKSTGMEFASEMLIKSLKANAKISHVPISLYPDERGRVPHLKTWRDGMRHLMQIFLDCPGVFYGMGSVVFWLSWVVIVLGAIWGPIGIGGQVEILGLHSMMFALLGSIFGIVLWSIGLFLAVRIDTKIKMYKHLLGIEEDKLFWHSVGVLLLSGGMFAAIVVYWGIKGFHFINIEKVTLAVVALAANGILVVANVITAHLLKRS